MGENGFDIYIMFGAQEAYNNFIQIIYEKYFSYILSLHYVKLRLLYTYFV